MTKKFRPSALILLVVLTTFDQLMPEEELSDSDWTDTPLVPGNATGASDDILVVDFGRMACL